MISKKISVWSLALMTVAAVCSLRGLPMMAKEGTQMLFFLGFSVIFFLLPASLVSAELGSAFSKQKGGVYTWIGTAFGSKWGFTAIWLQWIQNVVWYPTVLAFAAAAFAYFIRQPELANNGIFTGTITIVAYWSATLIALKGSNYANKVTTIGTILGTILPAILIAILGVVWLLTDNPDHLANIHTINSDTLSHISFIPQLSNFSSLAFLGGIIVLFAGIEVHAVNAINLANPASQYPKAIFLAAIIIIVVFLLGSSALAIIVPNAEIDLNQGLMQAFEISLSRFNQHWVLPILGLFIAIGAYSSIMSWITGPSKALLATAQNGEIPPILAKTNRAGIQQNILLLQGAIVTLLSSLYFIIKDVSVAFFLLSAMTITLYAVMYILMYLAGIKLRYSHPDLPRIYRVPCGNIGMIIIAIIGLVGVGFAFIVSFFPPDQLPIGNPKQYIAIVTGGFILFTGLPFLIQLFKKREWKEQSNDH